MLQSKFNFSAVGLTGRLMLFAATSALTLACATGAMAHGMGGASSGGGAEAAADKSEPGTLAEVVVTAQKRSESVQHIPATVSALGAEAIAERQIKDITDLQHQVPSMMVGQLYGSNLVTLRGISTGLTSGTEDPSVAVHVNGVYQPRSRSLDVALMDLERVEVLSGPQGTLYGRNATGGVVNYITKGPTQSFQGEVTGTAGNFDHYGVRGTISGPINDKVGFLASAIWDDQGEGFTKNLLPNAPQQTFEGRKVVGGHVDVTYQAAPNLKFSLDGMYLHSESSVLMAPLGPTNSTFVASFVGAQTFEPHKVISNVNSPFDSDYGQLSLTATWDLSPSVQVKSITAYQSYSDQMVIDNTGGVVNAVSVDQRNSSHTFTQELDVTTHLFSDRLTSIYGVFYFNDLFRDLANVPYSIAPPPNFYIFKTRQKAESYAVFTDQTLKVTDRLRLIAGLRFNKDDKDAVNGLNIPPYGDICSVKGTKSWEAWTPRIGAQFDVSPNIMAYANWQKGFKAGGFTANTCGNSYNPESIKGPEVGIKSELFGHRLRLNAAGFYYDYQNLQVEQVVGLAGFSVQNAASAVIKGVEMSAQAKVTNNLGIDLSMNFQSARYEKFSNCNQVVAYGACSTAATLKLSDLSGNWLNRAPPYSINLGVEYRIDIPGGADLLVRGESNWSGTTHYDEFDTPELTQRAYSVQNLYATYTPANSTYKIRAFMKNVADKDYKISGFYSSATGQSVGNWAPSRTVGAELTLKF